MAKGEGGGFDDGLLFGVEERGDEVEVVLGVLAEECGEEFAEGFGVIIAEAGFEAEER